MFELFFSSKASFILSPISAPSNLSSYSFRKTFLKPVMRTLVLPFLPSVIYMWTTARETRSKWRESKVNMYKQASKLDICAKCVYGKMRTSIKKKQSSRRRNAKEVKYAATIDCHFLVCLFVGLLMCRKIKANDSCARRYITSQQINWLKLKLREEDEEIFPFIYSLPFEVFTFFFFLRKTNYAARSLNRDTQAQLSELDVNTHDSEASVKGTTKTIAFVDVEIDIDEAFVVSFAHHAWSSRARKLKKLFA